MFEPHRISFSSFETWKQRTHPKLTLPHAHTYVHIYVVLQNVYFRVSDFIIITYSCTYTTYTSLMTCTYESLSLSPSFYIPSNIEVVCVNFGFAIRFNELFQRSGKQTRNIISLVSWEIILAHWTHLVISSQFFWKGNTYVVHVTRMLLRFGTHILSPNIFVRTFLWFFVSGDWKPGH